MAGDGALTEAEMKMSSEIGALREAVTRLTNTWQQQEVVATEGRRQLHEGMNQLSRQQIETKTEVAALKKEVTDEIKPVIKQVQQDRWRTEGMKSLGKIVWFGVGAFFAGVSWILYTFLGIGKPPG